MSIKSELIQIITIYRDVMRDLDTEHSTEIRADYAEITVRLRAIWKRSQGTDTLHQLAWGSHPQQELPPDL